MDHLCYLFLVFVKRLVDFFNVNHAFASVHFSLVVTCWERADQLALVSKIRQFVDESSNLSLPCFLLLDPNSRITLFT